MQIGHVIVTDTVRYEPWTNGHAIGFRATRLDDDAVGYIYLNPASDDWDHPHVFVYGGPTGDPGQDTPWHFYSITNDVFAS